MNSLSPYRPKQSDTVIQTGELLSQRWCLYEQQASYTIQRSDSRTGLLTGDPYGQENFEAANKQLANLRSLYTLVSDDDLIAEVLKNVPALYTLLREAVQPLQEAFSEGVIFRLDALVSDEDTTLRVVVKTLSAADDTAARMRQFKRQWWLDNIARSRASLIFDYE